MQPIPVATAHLRCNAGGHVVGAEVLPGIQVVTASHRVIVGRMLKISCRDGCPGVWESPDVAAVAQLLARAPESDMNRTFALLLGLDDRGGGERKAA